jgi:hypothetical protein
MVLMVRFPHEGTTGAEEDGAAQTSKFEQGEVNALLNGVPDLGTPACVTISCQTMVVAKSGGDSVRVGLCTGFVWE